MLSTNESMKNPDKKSGWRNYMIEIIFFSAFAISSALLIALMS